MTTCIVITRGLYQTNRTIEFEEYILKEDYHGKSSNTVPFVRDPLPRPVYWANVLITIQNKECWCHLVFCVLRVFRYINSRFLLKNFEVRLLLKS